MVFPAKSPLRPPRGRLPLTVRAQEACYTCFLERHDSSSTASAAPQRKYWKSMNSLLTIQKVCTATSYIGIIGFVRVSPFR